MHRLVFVDRLLATPVHLRHGATHDVLACWFGVDRSTITRAIGEVWPLLATRGCTIAPGIRLRTLAEVINHLGASGRVDTTTPQSQEEPSGLVRGDLRAPAQGALLTPDPGRARHRTYQELTGTRPPPRPPRTHERHHPSRRRTAFTPADHHPRGPSATVTTVPTCTLPRVTANQHELVSVGRCRWHRPRAVGHVVHGLRDERDYQRCGHSAPTDRPALR
nr:transposase family protein [Streptomyces sp. 3211]